MALSPFIQSQGQASAGRALGFTELENEELRLSLELGQVFVGLECLHVGPP